MGKSNIIEINGRRYDARSGAPLAGQASVVEPPRPTEHTARHQQTKQPAARSAAVQAVVSARPIAKPKPATKVVVHDAVKAHSQIRRQQRSKTLMRSTVAKPSKSQKQQIKATSNVEALIDKSAAHLRPKASVRRVDGKRLQHAQAVAKSQFVSRFGRPHGLAPDPPVHLPSRQPKPAEFPASHLPTNEPPQYISPTTDLLERALEAATSHEQAFFKSPKRRRTPSPAASLTTIVVTLLIVAGFVGFQNVNNMKLHAASSKAGFTASLPDYHPAGYHLSHLNAVPGTVALNFQSGKGSYAVTEKASDWDNDALRESFLAGAAESYQAVESGGRTLFLYGQNATWLSGGVWYQVQSNGLNNQQLVQLASSM